MGSMRLLDPDSPERLVWTPSIIVYDSHIRAIRAILADLLWSQEQHWDLVLWAPTPPDDEEPAELSPDASALRDAAFELSFLEPLPSRSASGDECSAPSSQQVVTMVEEVLSAYRGPAVVSSLARAVELAPKVEPAIRKHGREAGWWLSRPALHWRLFGRHDVYESEDEGDDAATQAGSSTSGCRGRNKRLTQRCNRPRMDARGI